MTDDHKQSTRRVMKTVTIKHQDSTHGPDFSVKFLVSPTLFNIFLERIMIDTLEDMKALSVLEVDQSPISTLLITSMA